MSASILGRDTLLGKLVRLPLELIPKNAVVPIFQGKFRGKRWIFGAGNPSYWLGIYEKEIRRLVETVVQPGHIFYDIGAHVGYFSLLAAGLAGSEGRVVAFEPSPRNLNFLKRHLALNSIHNAVVIEAAVSHADGYARFDGGVDSYQGHLSPQGACRVRTLSLDTVIRQGMAPPPQVMKIDVEGAEAQVLEGGLATLAEFRPVLIISLHGRQLREECVNLLTSRGYSVRPICGQKLEEAFDIFAWHPKSNPSNYACI